MITIDVVGLVNKVITWLSGLSMGGLIVFCIFAKSVSKKLIDLIVTLGIVTLIFWFLSDTGRLDTIQTSIPWLNFVK